AGGRDRSPDGVRHPPRAFRQVSLGDLSGAPRLPIALGGGGSLRAKPRLLFLCQTLPYPPDGGVNIRAYHVLRLLAREFRVTALCFFRRDDRVSREAVEGGVAGLRPFGEIEAFPIPQEYAVTRLVWDHLRSVVRRRAYTVYTYESRPFQARLGALLRQRFDLVHMDSLDLAGYLDRLEGTPVICTHQ